jgi:hypothetical protein
MPQPAIPPISPDGRYWWDGQQWQSLFTPDGMHRWNGQQWIPLATPFDQPPPAPVAPLTAPPPEKPAWLDQAPEWLASPPGAAAPEPPQPVMEQPAPAAWTGTARPRSRAMIYGTALLLIAVVGFGGWVVRGQLLASQASNDASLHATSPTPLLSDYERADRYLNLELGPPLLDATNTLTPLENACTPSLPPACKDALITTDKAMVKAEEVMNHTRDIPPCIARELAQFKDDWVGMEQGLTLAISGYQSNNRQLIIQGFQRFANIAQYVKADVDRITKAEQTCAH